MYNFFRPRITELSMIAVGQAELEKLQRSLAKENDVDGLAAAAPRVLNKLTLCFYPGVQVPHHVTNITGLDNYNLEDQRRFDAGAVRSISDFVGRLARPVCIVAHNGEK